MQRETFTCWHLGNHVAPEETTQNQRFIRQVPVVVWELGAVLRHRHNGGGDVDSLEVVDHHANEEKNRLPVTRPEATCCLGKDRKK